MQEKNRLAARRHRQALKEKETEEAEYLASLNERNAYLKQLIADTTAEVVRIKQTMMDLMPAYRGLAPRLA